MGRLEAIDIALICISAANLLILGAIQAVLLLCYFCKQKKPFKPVSYQIVQCTGFCWCSLVQIIISALHGILGIDLYWMMNVGYNFVYSAALTQIDQLFALFSPKSGFCGCLKRQKAPKKEMSSLVKFLINSIVYFVVLAVEVVNTFGVVSLAVYFGVQVAELTVSLLIVVYNVVLQVRLVSQHHEALVAMRGYWRMYFAALYVSFAWVLSNFVGKYVIAAFYLAKAGDVELRVRAVHSAMSVAMLVCCAFINTLQFAFNVALFRQDGGTVQVPTATEIGK